MTTVHTNSPGRFDSGPSSFLSTFWKWFPGKITLGDADILLLVTGDEKKYRSQHRFKRIVTRCDGLYYIRDEKQPPAERNKGLIYRYKIADAVIFQSEYARQFYEHVAGRRDVRSTVIHNGSDAKFCSKKREFGVVTCTDIRRSKRPHLIPAIASLLPRVPFFVLGRYSGKRTDNMVLLGNIERRRVQEYYNKYSTYLHLGYQDCCPNAVVEAICSGMGIVASNSGGVPEIVKRSGFLFQEESVGFDQIDYPPEPDLREVVTLIYSSCSVSPAPREDLSCREVMKKYDEFFKECLKG